ncbi:MAG TPA: hypothetical protein VHN37_11345 [Actinomycetota bacterium]|nr:hypothetical protein [Actinomycetota bacterium]
MKRALAVVMAGSAMVLTAAVPASAQDVADTNVTERIECLFRVYVTEGGEQGLDCLV